MAGLKTVLSVVDRVEQETRMHVNVVAHLRARTGTRYLTFPMTRMYVDNTVSNETPGMFI